MAVTNATGIVAATRAARPLVAAATGTIAIIVATMVVLPSAAAPAVHRLLRPHLVRRREQAAWERAGPAARVVITMTVAAPEPVRPVRVAPAAQKAAPERVATIMAQARREPLARPGRREPPERRVPRERRVTVAQPVPGTITMTTRHRTRRTPATARITHARTRLNSRFVAMFSSPGVCAPGLCSFVL